MLTQTQWFIFAIVMAGSIGFHRGWERSLITSAIVVLVTWFLLLAGDVWFANVLTDWQVLRTMPTTQVIHAVSAPVYGAVIVLAHMAGTAWGRAPKNAAQRWLGTLPAAVTGAAFLAYLSDWAAPTLFSQAFAAYFPLLFGIGVILNLLFLYMAAKSPTTASSKPSDS